jgi:hypothetical protein
MNRTIFGKRVLLTTVLLFQFSIHVVYAQADITPSFNVIAPCPSCAPASNSPTISGSTYTPSVTVPSAAPLPTASSSIAPCSVDTSDVSDNAHNRRHHKKHHGTVSNVMEMFFKFLLQLINQLLHMLGGGQISTPETTPTPSSALAPTGGGIVDPNPCDIPTPSVTAQIPTTSTAATVPVVSTNPHVALSPSGTTTGNWWKPTADKPIQLHWQLSQDFDPARDMVAGATVYDFDGEKATKAIVDAVHAKGFKAICYFDAGVFESYRSDASKFPKEVIGKQDIGWNGSNWLDIRQTAVILPIMEARIRDWCQAKGFDAVEPDEITNWSNDSGFPLTAADQTKYNKAIADLAHKYNLSVGLKGNQEQAAEQEPFFDWNLTEECYQYQECDLISAFAQHNKATWVVEYAATPNCADAKAKHFNAMKRDLNLVGPTASGYLYQPCIPTGTTTWQ